MSAPRLYSDAERKERKAAGQKKRRVEQRGRVHAIEATYRAKNRARAAAWRDANRQKLRDYFKALYAAKGRSQTAESRAKAATYYQLNKDRLLANKAAWKKANNELVRAHAQNRRARIAGNGGTLSRDIVTRLLRLQRGRCANCTNKLLNHQIDHVTPISRRGLNTDDNVQLLCPRCNRRKHSKDPIDFARENGRLI